MENKKSIRWKQRFKNFEKAFLQFEKAINSFENLDDLSKEGLIQRFEYTLELAWKTLKDYLEAEEVIAKTPKSTIKNAFQIDIINNGELWINMLEDRNLMAHTYNEANFNIALNNIHNKYFFEIKELYAFLKNEQ